MDYPKLSFFFSNAINTPPVGERDPPGGLLDKIPRIEYASNEKISRKMSLV